MSTRGGSSKAGETPNVENSSNAPPPIQKVLKLVQVQIVHRHGDRTPITPMRNETFWKHTLPSPQILENIAMGTNIVRTSSSSDPKSVAKQTHAAGGKGAFGQLTTLGLFQMVELGSKLREDLTLVEEINTVEGEDESDEILDLDSDESDNSKSNKNANLEIILQKDTAYTLKHKHLFSSKTPLSPQTVQVMSTDFPRTIQSVQGLLIGLFPDGMSTDINIDARHTNIMIPDPQPRQTQEQIVLEQQLAQRPHLLKKEIQMKDLALHITAVLQQHFLGKGYDEISFGVGEEDHSETSDDDDMDEETSNASSSKPIKPLPWVQLSEILKCLAVRDMLPPSITPEHQHIVSEHAAWRWFENLRHPRLAWLSMNAMMKCMIDNFHTKIDKGNDDEKTVTPLLHIISAHDSTLIGLLCAFRLEQPSEWPEYGSFFKMELWQVIDNEEDKENQNDDEPNQAQYLVRFSLNSKTLHCNWGSSDGTPLEFVPLEELLALLKVDGTEAEQDDVIDDSEDDN